MAALGKWPGFPSAVVAVSGGPDSLALLHLVTDPVRLVELTVLVLANLLATVLRFVALRGWVFRKAAR